MERQSGDWSTGRTGHISFWCSDGQKATFGLRPAEKIRMLFFRPTNFSWHHRLHLAPSSTGFEISAAASRQRRGSRELVFGLRVTHDAASRMACSRTRRPGLLPCASSAAQSRIPPTASDQSEHRRSSCQDQHVHPQARRVSAPLLLQARMYIFSDTHTSACTCTYRSAHRLRRLHRTLRARGARHRHRNASATMPWFGFRVRQRACRAGAIADSGSTICTNPGSAGSPCTCVSTQRFGLILAHGAGGATRPRYPPKGRRCSSNVAANAFAP